MLWDEHSRQMQAELLYDIDNNINLNERMGRFDDCLDCAIKGIFKQKMNRGKSNTTLSTSGMMMNVKSTRMWNMIASPATPTVCLEQKYENFQSRNVTLSMSSSSQKHFHST